MSEEQKKPIWWKPSIGTQPSPCWCCETSEILPLETRLFNSMSGWSITKDGKYFFEEDQDKEFDECKTLGELDAEIPEGDESEYLADIMMALRDATYQRHSKGVWVCIRKGPGYA